MRLAGSSLPLPVLCRKLPLLVRGRVERRPVNSVRSGGAQVLADLLGAGPPVLCGQGVGELAGRQVRLWTYDDSNPPGRYTLLRVPLADPQVQALILAATDCWSLLGFLPAKSGRCHARRESECGIKLEWGF
jgi:hypothetical protein